MHKTRCVIMKHDANKAGLHYDLRIKKKNGKYISWRMIYDAVKPLEVPVSKGSIKLIETEEHTEEEALYTGTIKEGEYGAGKISKYFESEVDIIKTDDFKTNIVFEHIRGKYQNEMWVLFKMSKEEPVWILFKKK